MAHIDESHDRGYTSNHENVIDVEDLLNCLDESQKCLVRDYYWEGKSFITIAAEQRKYKSTIHGRHEVAINKLRHYVGETHKEVIAR